MADQRDPDPYRYRHTEKMLRTAVGRKVWLYLQDEFEFQVEYLHPLYFSDPLCRDREWEKMIKDSIIDGRPLFSRRLSYGSRSSLSPEIELCFRSEKRETHLQSTPGPLFPELECAPMDSLREALTGSDGILVQVRDRVNGLQDRVGKSYSKYLIIPLFKPAYTEGDRVLYVREIQTNMLTLSVEISGRNWVKELTGDRSYHEVVPVDLPLERINDLAAIEEAVMEAIVPDDGLLMMDIDDIDVGILGYTIDVSRLCRDDFYQLTGRSLKYSASFKKDGEIVTDRADPDCVVTPSETIQLVRMLALLAIGEEHGSCRTLMDAYRSGALGQWIPFDPREQKAVERIYKHLEDSWEEERDAYSDVFETDGYPPRYPAFFPPGGSVRRLSEQRLLYDLIAQIRSQTALFANGELYQAMSRIAGMPIRCG